MKQFLTACLLVTVLAGCASTYTVPNDVDTSQLTVRSRQGHAVSAFIYKSPESCAEKEALKSNGSNNSKASKTYTIPSSTVVFSVLMHPGAINTYSCKATIKMNISEGQHYVVDLVSDRGKHRCNNRIFNVNDVDAAIDAQYIDATEAHLNLSAGNFCEKNEFQNINVTDGKFTSTAYLRRAYSTGVGYGTKTDAVKEQ